MKEIEPEGYKATAVKFCATRWYKYWCEKGHYVAKPRLCRMRRYCVRCADGYKRLKVSHAMKLFGVIEGWVESKLYLIHLVFTFPKEIWDEIIKDIDKAYDCVYESLRYPLGLSGGVAKLHMIHTKNPLGGWYPHIHVIVPNVVVVKNGGMSWFRRVRPYFNEKMLKERFGIAIEKRFGIPKKPNIYIQYIRFSDKAKARHVLKYAFRLPIEDFAPYLKAGLSEDEKKFVLSVLNFKRHLVRWFGWLADGVKSRYIGEFERFEEFLERIKGLCPIHFTPLKWVGWLDRPPPINDLDKNNRVIMQNQG